MKGTRILFGILIFLGLLKWPWGAVSAELRARGENTFIADFGARARGMFGLILGARTWEEVKFDLTESGAVKEMNVDRFGVFKKQ